ncbi:MAG: T9SS type A sorting domain-containing protein [Ignavibacteriae bacterium]|nr:T9SS type A sorting domain-containing protein [Ignavibacteriota bacterium]
MFNQSAVRDNILINKQAGIAGIILNSKNNYGTTNGCEGKLYFNSSILENTSAITPSSSSKMSAYSQVKAIDDYRLHLTIVGSGDEYCPGNKLLIIQMRGAEVNYTKSDAYGKVTSYSDAGNYEFTRIESITGNTITLNRPLTRSYNSSGKVQIVRVPEFKNYDVTDKLICPKWNDTIFGVIAFSVSDTLRLKQSIIADGAGFSGGKSIDASTTPQEHLDDYFGLEDSSKYALKGNGISNYLGAEHRAARGAVANAGGGGNNHNAGGGGGANGGCGGKGGFGWDLMLQGNKNLSQGIGGYATDNSGNKIFMGGGGGAGHSNEGSGTNGGDGGGIIIIDAKVIVVEGGQISSNGTSVKNAPYDGAGGGGGGGTVIFKTKNIVGNLSIESYGGSGGGVTVHRDGPGGGGGGGVIGFSLPEKPTGVNLDYRGGYGGKSRTLEDYGQTDGCSGVVLTNIDIPGDNTILEGINDELPIQSEAVTVYPLPADEMVTVISTKDFISTSCIVYDILGNNVGNGIQNQSGNWQVNVSQLNSGVFFGVLTSDSNTKIVRVLVRH